MDEFNPNQNPQQPEQEIPSVPQPNPIPATPQAPTDPQINVQPPVYNVQPPVNPQINQPGPHSSSNGLAIAGLVCGILSLAFCWVWYLGIPLAICGIVFGVLGMKKAEPNKRGMAIAGLVCGIVGLALCIVIIACVAAWISSLSYGSNYYYDYFSTM